MTNKIEAGWNFDNSYTKLPDIFYTTRHPMAVRSPKLVMLNESLAEDLGLVAEALKSDDGVAVFAGNEFPDGAAAIAQAYAGHQFGQFTILGDGRAMLIGEQITPTNERFDIQLKGSGKTRYSRGGDGRSTLGPMLREYIISEAMHALGIPTTRGLAVVSTGEAVMRERKLPGAILTRVASSHLRVGTFEYIAKMGSTEELRALADYTINRHFPYAKESDNPYVTLLQEVIKRQAKLIAKWQHVGFIHGVMNTDNMALSGETIDYGPCAFIDTYDSKTVFSSIDRDGRYAYGNQPRIGGWNLVRFAETLLPLVHDDMEEAIQIAQASLDTYGNLFQTHWLIAMRAKLGLYTEEKEDYTLVEELLLFMETYEADYTYTFNSLTTGHLEEDIFKNEAFKKWYEKWQSRLDRQPETKASVERLMKANNPFVIPRNYLVEEALEAAVEHDDYSVMKQLLNILSTPYDYTNEQAEFSKLPPKERYPYQTFCGT